MEVELGIHNGQKIRINNNIPKKYSKETGALPGMVGVITCAIAQPIATYFECIKDRHHEGIIFLYTNEFDIVNECVVELL